MIEAWKNGTFVDDLRTAPPDAAITPAGLDQAALDPCVGAAFYPGIEVSWKVRDEFRFVQAFRLDPDRIRPGDVTAQMSLPWQSDFIACAVELKPRGTPPLTWWPAQRPIDVRQQPDGPPVTWARAFDKSRELNVEEMIKEWSRLGFVLPEGDALLEEGSRRLRAGPDAMPGSPRTHVTVVGGGPAGLASAIRLRLHGLGVTVCDAGSPATIRLGERVSGRLRARLARCGSRRNRRLRAAVGRHRVVVGLVHAAAG